MRKQRVTDGCGEREWWSFDRAGKGERERKKGEGNPSNAEPVRCSPSVA